MTMGETLASVWQQVLVEGKTQIELEREAYIVKFLRAKKLRMMEFNFRDFRIAGIEQNPKTTSNWAALARAGSRIMQFRCEGKYIANVCEGKLTRYPAGRATEIPE